MKYLLNGGGLCHTLDDLILKNTKSKKEKADYFRQEDRCELNAQIQAYHVTRMHSSRMRTGRSLTVCRSLLPGGGCLLGGVCSGGCLLLGEGVSALGGGIPPCTEADTPPVNRMTDRCKNITLATTSLRPVKMV